MCYLCFFVNFVFVLLFCVYILYRLFGLFRLLALFDNTHNYKTKGSHITDEEIRGAEDKFAESLHLAQMGMFNLLENDVSSIAYFY